MTVDLRPAMARDVLDDRQDAPGQKDPARLALDHLSCEAFVALDHHLRLFHQPRNDIAGLALL